ncbi:LysM peptidoglycan-binding domain-containing protein [Suttonella sp. R2A3]|uniref:type IV pilus assembly protein FimV n=1 Tax=Suttonella sp. R2A3 TaxID=2908648 RepID=UPI001F360DF2|nr:FimV/HubP family polar landmark protein [Suttonella sp. R2A3]UJF24790.1 LysM peptidoglycan-binding domain-containing protein [Suttonella sp. R2A3]
MRLIHKMRAAILLASGMSLSQLASAFSLGPIEVHSSIGQPLNAQITISGLDKAQAKQISIALADASAYQSRGMKKLPGHEQMAFSLVPQGSAYAIRVTTTSNVREPFINFLLTVDSQGDSVTREYAVFLNPDLGAAAGLGPKSAPTVAPAPVKEPQASVDTSKPSENKPAEAPVKKVPPAEPEKPAPVVAKKAEPAPPAEKPKEKHRLWVSTSADAQIIGWQGNEAPQPEPAKPAYTGNTYGPVKPGETLYSIANTVMPAGYSNNSAMRQIYNANKSAFSSNSLSSLMSGYVLNIPNFTGASTVTVTPEPANPAAPQPTAKQPPQFAERAADSQQNDQSANPADTSAKVDAEEAKAVVKSGAAQNPELADKAEAMVASVAEAIENNQEAVDTPETQVVEEGVGEAESSEPPVESEPLPSDSESEEVTESVDESPEVTEEISEQIEAEQSPHADEQEMGDEAVETPPLESSEESNSTNDDLQSQESQVGETTSEPDDKASAEVATAVAPQEPAAVTNEQPRPTTETNEPSFLNQVFVLLPNWQWLAILGALLLGLIAWLFKGRMNKQQAGDEETFDLESDEMKALIAQIKSFEEGDDSIVVADNSSQYPDNSNDYPDEFDGSFGISDAELAALDQQYEEDIDHIEDTKPKLANKDDDHHAEDLADPAPELESEPQETKPLLKEFSDKGWLDGFNEEKPSGPQPFEDAPSTSSKPEDVDDFLMGWSTTEEPVDSATSEPEQATDKPAEEGEDNWFMEFDEPQKTPSEEAELKPEPEQAKSTAPELVADHIIEEMEINLDLASSFIITGNAEKAKKWLDDVLIYGTEEQKSRAHELLNEIKSG